MPIVHIYRAEIRICSQWFRDRFYIIRELNRDELRWEADEEQGTSQKGGEIHIWIQGATSAPKISFVRPDWHLAIDSVDFEAGFYEDIDIGGKTVELRYGLYTFRCQFPLADAGPPRGLSS